MITLDASVLVAAASPDDPAGVDAAAVIDAAIQAGLTVHQPSLAFVEVAAAIARRTGDETSAFEAVEALGTMPGIVIHPLDLDAAAEAAFLASRLRLRGADAVYAAVAHRLETILITLDDEMLARSRPLIDAVVPAEWLSRRS